MYEAIGKEDRKSLRRHLHQLKGSLGAVYALEASAMTERLETETDSAAFQVLHAHVNELEEVINILNALFQAYTRNHEKCEA